MPSLGAASAFWVELVLFEQFCACDAHIRESGIAPKLPVCFDVQEISTYSY